MFLSVVTTAGGGGGRHGKEENYPREADTSGDRWKGADPVLFFIYTPVFSVSL